MTRFAPPEPVSRSSSQRCALTRYPRASSRARPAPSGSSRASIVRGARQPGRPQFGKSGHTLENLRDQGLVERVNLSEDNRGLTLTTDARDLLDSDSLKRDNEPSKVFYAGVSRSREMDHDSNLYAMQK